MRGAIGHLNWINLDRLSMTKGASIGSYNRIKGKFSLIMKKEARIGNHDIIAGDAKYEPVSLVMEEKSRIVGSHYINMCSNISIGVFTTIAGGGTQIWTHSFFYTSDFKSYRVDGEVHIGDFCYIGSGCIICPNVRIADHVIVGAGSNIATNLDKSGLYVSQPLRYKEYDVNESLNKLGAEVFPGIYKKQEKR